MKLCSIETTPNPNCMKLNLDEQISAKPVTLNSGTEVVNLPEVARQLLAIYGIRLIFLANDFITLMWESSADWQPILVEAARLIGLAEGADSRLADIAQTEEQKTTAPDSTPDSHISIPNRDLYTTAAPASNIVTHLRRSDVFGSNENRYNQNLGGLR